MCPVFGRRGSRRERRRDGSPGGDAATTVDRGVEVIDCLEVAIDDGLVDERPKVFGGLKFRRVGRQVDEPHTVRDREPGFDVPTRAVEEQHDDPLRACPDMTEPVGD
jgi:hypothetical protein